VETPATGDREENEPEGVNIIKPEEYFAFSTCAPCIRSLPITCDKLPIEKVRLAVSYRCLMGGTCG
jgi:hypothetical protein